MALLNINDTLTLLMWSTEMIALTYLIFKNTKKSLALKINNSIGLVLFRVNAHSPFFGPKFTCTYPSTRN